MLFSAKTELKSKVIFHSSNLRLPERQQDGLAELSPAGFLLRLAAKGDAPAMLLSAPLARVRSVRAFELKSYSSFYYLVQVDYLDDAGQPREVRFETRAFLKRATARTNALAWKEHFRKLTSHTGGH